MGGWLDKIKGIPVLGDAIDLGEDLYEGAKEYVYDPIIDPVVGAIDETLVEPWNLENVGNSWQEFLSADSPYSLFQDGVETAVPKIKEYFDYIDPDPNNEKSILNSGIGQDIQNWIRDQVFDEEGNLEDWVGLRDDTTFGSKNIGGPLGLEKLISKGLSAGITALDPKYKKIQILGAPTWDTDAVLEQSYNDAIKQQQRTEIAQEVNRFSNQWDIRNQQDDILKLQEYEYYLTNNSDAVSILNQYRDTDYQEQQAQRVEFFSRTRLDPYIYAQ